MEKEDEPSSMPPMPIWTSPRLSLGKVTRLVHLSAINTIKPSSFVNFHCPTIRVPASFVTPKLTLKNLLSPLPPLRVQKYTMMSVNGIKKEKVVIIGSGNWFVALRSSSLPEGRRNARRISKPILTRLSSIQGLCNRTYSR